MANLQTDKKTENKKAMRDSGIELLKIFAIVLIVFSHVAITLTTKLNTVPSTDYVIDISVASKNINNFFLSIFLYCGKLGNDIFFICSAWFLLKSSKCSRNKWFSILFEVWVISILILGVTYFLLHGEIASKAIIKSILPTAFSSNWYITCYLLFYPIHPFLNIIIEKIDQRSLLRCAAALFAIYFGICFAMESLLECNNLLRWIAIYFVMAYLQKYSQKFMDSTKKNVILLLVGLIGFIGIAIMANVLGLKVGALSNKVLHWNSNSNPFLVAIAIALFNLMRKCTFKNKVINYISGLSLLIYIIHENMVLREYFRPRMWMYVYENYGYSQVVLWVFALSLIVFAFGLITSMIYDKTLRILVKKIGDKVFEILGNICLKIEGHLVKEK